MKKATQFVAFLVLLLCSAALTESTIVAEEVVYPRPSNPVSPDTTQDDYSNTWCIAKPSVDDQVLEENIVFSCKEIGVDCSVIQEGGSCFYPNNRVSHASVVMNLYYKVASKNPWNCNFNGSALIVSLDPSYGKCYYPL